MLLSMTHKQPSDKLNDQDNKTWVGIVRRYNYPDNKKSIWQIINSLGPCLLIWYLMYYSIEISYWITVGLAFLAAGFLVRIFIIFHDCGHGSFFSSRLANNITGTILGCLTFTPSVKWHNDHAIHHSTVGDLDRRGVGDVWTITVEEYKSFTPGKKLIYRLYRNPVIIFGISSFLLFVVLFRFPKTSMKKSELWSVIITNIFFIVYITGLSLLIGFKTFAMIQLPITYISTSAGVWLFYLQHQYSDVVWTRHEDWDYKTIALKGCSYLKFPRILQWFTGNIGFHHIHHLSPRIPNYKLEKCHKENRMFNQVKPVTFVPSLRAMRLRLWNEEQNKLISFSEFNRISMATG